LHRTQIVCSVRRPKGSALKMEVRTQTREGAEGTERSESAPEQTATQATKACEEQQWRPPLPAFNDLIQTDKRQNLRLTLLLRTGTYIQASSILILQYRGHLQYPRRWS
jgi:hypothetical protein